MTNPQPSFSALGNTSASARSRVLMSFAYFFLIMTGYYLLKPLRATLIAMDLGAGTLPGLNLVLLPTILLVVGIYDRILDSFPRRLVMPCLALNLAIHPLIFRVAWQMGGMEGDWMWWLGAAYYLWLGIFNVFAVMAFWSMVNDLFSPEEARLFFGYIGAGGPAGAMLGSFLASTLSRSLGSENLLILASLILAPCAWLASVLVRTAGERRRDLSAKAVDSPAVPSKPEMDTGGASGFRLILSSRYLRMLGLMILTSKLVNGIFDYHYHVLLQAEGMTRDQLTAFGAGVFLKVNVLAITLQLFAVSWILKKWGPVAGLVPLPLFCCAGSASVLLGAGLHSFALVSILGQGVMYSLYQASREFIYMPTDRRTKYRAKAVLDTFGFRAGTGVGALVIMGFQMCFPAHVKALAVLALVLAVCWIVLAVWIGRQCQEQIAKNQETSGNPVPVA